MVLLYMIVVFGVAILIANIAIKNGAGNKRSKPTYQTAQPSPVDIWWKNLRRTPLSMAESERIADQVARFYSGWKHNWEMNHSWLCIAINANKVECRQLSGNCGSVPTPTYYFSHSLSCQADREELAGYILRAVRRVDPTTSLYLDGDSLILSTN